MTLLARTIDTPFGELAVVADPVARVVVRSGFVAVRDLDGLSDPVVPGAHPFLDEVAGAVAAWLAGDVQALPAVPLLLPAGEGFRIRAWRALHEVPAGGTVTYQGLAELAGAPGAARAAGTACATNPLAPFLPCHRVVPAGGAGVGRYGYGAAMKAAMLRHEGALA
jgi:methylated-DNA-[protein]-cysteine S-methyltransferase